MFPLLVVLGIIHLKEIQQTSLEYDLGRDREKLNHLLFKDDLKLFTKCDAELDSQVQPMRISPNGIKIGFLL